MANWEKLVKQDPVATLLTSMMSLYVNYPLTRLVGQEEAKSLPPAEAMILSLMCLKGRYNSSGLHMELGMIYGIMDRRDARQFVEITLDSLTSLGYLKLASKEAEQVYQEHVLEGEWGLPELPFVVTATGAKRIGSLVANLTGTKFADVVKKVQKDSKDAGAAWLVKYKNFKKQEAVELKKAEVAKKAAPAKKPAVATKVSVKKPAATKKPTAKK